MPGIVRSASHGCIWEIGAGGAAVADADFDTLVAEMRNMHLEEVQLRSA